MKRAVKLLQGLMVKVSLEICHECASVLQSHRYPIAFDGIYQIGGAETTLSRTNRVLAQWMTVYSTSCDCLAYPEACVRLELEYDLTNALCKAMCCTVPCARVLLPCSVRRPNSSRHGIESYSPGIARSTHEGWSNPPTGPSGCETCPVSENTHGSCRGVVCLLTNQMHPYKNVSQKS